MPLPPAVREKLLRAGFRTVADLEGVGPVDLASGESIVALKSAGVRRFLLTRDGWDAVPPAGAFDSFVKHFGAFARLLK